MRIATRKSRLSLRQVELVEQALRSHSPCLNTERVLLDTAGDLNPQVTVEMMGVEGVFEMEVNLAVLDGRADIAVHSLKDVPSGISPELVLGAVLPRESPLEAIVSRDGVWLAGLRDGATVGTSSLRRQLAISTLRSDLNIVSMRGNVDTRVRKLLHGDYDAIVLAEAGLRRLGLEARISGTFTPEEITPAPGQGAIGIYARAGHAKVLRELEKIDHHKSRLEVTLERRIMKSVGGGCLTPLGILAHANGTSMSVIATLYSSSGSKVSVRRVSRKQDQDGLVREIAGAILGQNQHPIREGG